MNTTLRRAALAANLAALLAVLAFGASGPVEAAELNPAAVKVRTPEQYQWRDPTDQAATNQTVLQGDPNKTGSLYININKFKSGRFGNAHYHPNDRFITVIAGAAWRGTGTIVDPAHATRVPKGTFMIDHATKLHWDGTKEETGAYLITGIGPATNIETPKVNGPYAGGDPSAATIVLPNQIPWKEDGGNRSALLAGDPTKSGLYVMMVNWRKGNNFSRPQIYPNDRFVYVLEGTLWVGTGAAVDANDTVAMRPGTLLQHIGKQALYQGAKDEDAVVVVIGEGPATPAQ